MSPAKIRENKNRDANNPKVRMPRELLERLDAELERLKESYENGRAELPAGVDCENIPRWAVIAKALDELADHRERSRRSAKKKKATTAAK